MGCFSLFVRDQIIKSGASEFIRSMHHCIHLTVNSVTMKRAVPLVTNAPCPKKQPPPKVKPTLAISLSAASKPLLASALALPNLPNTLDHCAGSNGTASVTLPASNTSLIGLLNQR